MAKVEILYDSYHDIVEEFGRERIQNRFQDLLLEYEGYLKKHNLTNEDVMINTYSLQHAVLDYFTDISRLKKFHKINRVNTFKVTAYQVNWLLRRKPIQIVRDEEEKLVYINEKFILSHIMARFKNLVGYDFYSELKPENQKVILGYIDSLFYYLKYRNCSSQVLEFALLSIGAGIAACNVELSDAFKDAFLEQKK